MSRLIRRYCISFFALGLVLSVGSSASQISRKNYVFNLTGSMQCFGDITGPLWTLLKIKELKPQANYIAVTDERAEKIISAIYGEKLDEVAKDLGVKFYSIEDAYKIPIADVSFELFFGGRKIHVVEGEPPFTNLRYIDDKTITVISDTMHGKTLDQIVGPGFELYFKPPGIGKERSGIIDSPDLEKISRKPEKVQRTIAAHLFSNKNLPDLLLKSHIPGAEFTFLYGAHNEIFAHELMGQTGTFIKELERKYSGKPIIIFTPNSKEELQKVIPGFKRVLSVEDLNSGLHFEERAYLISLPKVTGFQFLALMAIADLPILIEGNSSVSSAIRLEKEFLMYRSAWNGPQIKSLQEIDGEVAKSWIYSDVYNLDKLSLPHFSHYFDKDAGRRMWAKYSLSDHTPDFPTKLLKVVELAEKLSTNTGAIDYPKIAKSIFAKTNDEYLEYSILWDAAKRGKLSQQELDQERKNLSQRGLDYQRMEARFVPVRPNFSQKIDLLEKGRVVYQTINLVRSKDRREVIEKQIAKMPNFPHRFVEAIEGKKLDLNELREKNIYTPDVGLKPGELGIYMTTLQKVIPGVIAEASKTIVTFEDDVVFPADLEKKFEAALTAAPSNWDILYLGCNQNYYADDIGLVSAEKKDRFDYPLCPQSALSKEKESPWAKIISSRCIAGAWAYALSPAGAQKLARDLVPIRKALDVRIAELVESGSVNAYCASPEIVRLNSEVQSTIR